MKKIMGSAEQRPRGTPACVIGRGVKVEGRLSCGGFLRIEGECSRGSELGLGACIQALGSVVVAEGAKVEADLKGKDIVVAGWVVGSIEAENRVHLASTARVMGEIRSRRFSMEVGAMFSGSVLFIPPSC